MILLAAMAVTTLTPASAATTHSINHDTVSASGMNSCGDWYHTSGTYQNYCPFCGAHGALEWNPKGTPEGEFTCGHCDADFCICGRCKAGGSGVYLLHTVTPQKKTIEAGGGSEKAPTMLEKAIYVLRTNESVLGYS